MSNLSVYSKFGSVLNDPNGQVGIVGPAGVGFVLTPGGDYDIQGRSFVDVDNIDAQTISLGGLTNDEGVSTILVIDGSEIKTRTTFPEPYDQQLNTSDSPEFVGLILSSIATDNAETSILLIDSAKQIVQRDAPYAFGDQAVDTTATPTFAGINISGLANNVSSTDILVANGTAVQKRTGTNSFPNQNLSTGQSVSFDSMSLTGIPTSTVDTNIVVMSGDLLSKRSGVNSFPNQSVNSGANVTFGDLTATNVISNTIKAADNTTCLQLSNVAVSIPATLRTATGTLQMTQVTNPGTPGGLTGYLWNNSNVPTWTNTAGTATSLLNPYLNNLGSTQAPTFSGITATGLATDNAENTIVLINGSNQLVTREGTNSFPNQALNTTSNVIHNNITVDQVATNILTDESSGLISLNVPLVANTGTFNASNTNSLIYTGITEFAGGSAFCVVDGSNIIRKKTTHRAYAASTGVSSTASQVTWSTKVSITDTFLGADYKVEYSTLLQSSSGAGSVDMRLQVDGVTINSVDIAGADSNQTGDWHCGSGFYIVPITAGTRTITFQFRARDAGTASVRDSYLLLSGLN
jgi:hypothetical protein